MAQEEKKKRTKESKEEKRDESIEEHQLQDRLHHYDSEIAPSTPTTAELLSLRGIDFIQNTHIAAYITARLTRY